MGFGKSQKTVAKDVVCLSRIFIALGHNDYSLLQKFSYVAAFLNYYFCAKFFFYKNLKLQ